MSAFSVTNTFSGIKCFPSSSGEARQGNLLGAMLGHNGIMSGISDKKKSDGAESS